MAPPLQILPKSGVTEFAPGAAFAAAGIPDIAVIMGPASKGTINAPTNIGAQDIAGLVATFGSQGAAVKEAAYTASQVAQGFVFIRMTTATVAATKSTPAVVRNVASDFTSTLSGTPTDGFDWLITFTLGGVTGTGPITYTTFDGITTSAPISLATATTIVLGGVTVTLGSAKTITAGDTIAFWTMPASSTVLPTTFVGTGSSVITVTGTPLDAYEVAFKVIVGGTIGTIGITYQYSLDYGAPVPTWTATTGLSVSVSLLLLDGPISLDSTGLTLNFAAGTLVAGDLYTFGTTGPAYDSAGATAALAALKAWNGAWTWVRMVGPVSESLGGAVDTIMSGWDASGTYSWGVVDARDHGSHESLTAWSARQVTEWTPYVSTHVGFAEGMARIVCPINGRSNRRGAMTSIMPRALSLPIQIDWAEYDLGALPAGVTISDVNNVVVEHDANTDSSLLAIGAITLRRWPGAVGVYPTKAALPGPATDIGRVPLRRVMNVAKSVYDQLLRLQVVKAFRVNKAGVKAPLIAGDIIQADVDKINRLGRQLIGAAVVSTQMCSGIDFAVNPTPLSLGGGSYRLRASLQITPLIYVDDAEGTAQFISAQLSGTV